MCFYCLKIGPTIFDTFVWLSIAFCSKNSVASFLAIFLRSNHVQRENTQVFAVAVFFFAPWLRKGSLSDPLLSLNLFFLDFRLFLGFFLVAWILRIIVSQFVPCRHADTTELFCQGFPQNKTAKNTRKAAMSQSAIHVLFFHPFSRHCAQLVPLHIHLGPAEAQGPLPSPVPRPLRPFLLHDALVSLLAVASGVLWVRMFRTLARCGCGCGRWLYPAVSRRRNRLKTHCSVFGLADF